jgi:HSP20 family protein
MYALTRPYRRAADVHGAFGRLNRIVDEAFRGWPFAGWEGDPLVGAWIPPVDVTEDNDTVRITAELPGIGPEDVKINLENNVLTISGEKTQETREEGRRPQRYERVYGSFERSFTVPSSVDAERIEATCDNGVLAVTLPKSENAKPRAINVAVKRSGEIKQPQVKQRIEAGKRSPAEG